MILSREQKGEIVKSLKSGKIGAFLLSNLRGETVRANDLEREIKRLQAYDTPTAGACGLCRILHRCELTDRPPTPPEYSQVWRKMETRHTIESKKILLSWLVAGSADEAELSRLEHSLTTEIYKPFGKFGGSGELENIERAIILIEKDFGTCRRCRAAGVCRLENQVINK